MDAPHVVASVEILGQDGTAETITGTTIHPIWSVDRQEWVPMGELTQGEHLLSLHPSPLRGRGTEGEGAVTAIVLSVTLSRVAEPVYNIEVHGEHVYQVGELGLLVHNACETATLINGGSFLLANSTSSGMVRLSGSSVRVANAYVQGHASTAHFLGRLRGIANKFGMQEVVFENVYFLNFSLRAYPKTQLVLKKASQPWK